MVYDTTTKEGRESRIRQFAEEYLKKSTMKGDYYWRKAAEILQEDGDYKVGYDDGCEPKGRENQQTN